MKYILAIGIIVVAIYILFLRKSGVEPAVPVTPNPKTAVNPQPSVAPKSNFIKAPIDRARAVKDKANERQADLVE